MGLSGSEVKPSFNGGASKINCDHPPGEDSSNPSAIPTKPAPQLQPDHAETDKFLTAAFGNKDVWLAYQTSDDNKTRPKDPLLTRSIFGKHDHLAGGLAELNAKGGAVWVGVTKTTGKRKKENVYGVWTVPLDLDEGTQAKLDAVMSCGRPPDIVVESSLGKAQCHWINDGSVLPMHFEPVTKRLLTKFGGDAAVCALTQVMRLPGYWHQKDPDNPFMVRVAHINPALPPTGNTLLADLLEMTADVDMSGSGATRAAAFDTAAAIASADFGTAPSHKRTHDQSSHLAPSLGHVAKALGLLPNTPENIPLHRDPSARVDFVRMIAGVYGSTGGNEPFYVKVVEPWALQNAHSFSTPVTAEYVRERWDSVKKDGVGLGWSWLSDVTGYNARFGADEAFDEPVRAEDTAAMDAATENAPDDISENALALRFADLHAENVRYAAKEAQWLEWDGDRWCPDEKLHLMTLARQFCRQAAKGGN
jgi:hypothetical protein